MAAVTGPARLRVVHPPDQVVRLEAFRKAHPAVVIEYTRSSIGGHWAADWTGPDGALNRSVNMTLRYLLDTLDRAFGVS